MASPTRFSVTRRNLRPARSLPSKSEPFAALPSVKKYPELKGAILTHASDNINGEGEKENEEEAPEFDDNQTDPYHSRQLPDNDPTREVDTRWRLQELDEICKL